MKIRLLLYCLLLWTNISMKAQAPVYGKMSSMVRQLVMEQDARCVRARQSKPQSGDGNIPQITAFVRVKGDAEKVLGAHGCRQLAQWGDISVATIPTSRLSALSASAQVLRIEANNSCSVLLDTAAIVHHVDEVYAGKGLSQGYTGKGVVVGLQDVGFDLTHPTFMNKEGTETRIRRFWDQLSTDTVDSRMVVGQEYTTADSILGYAHSFDAEVIWHGCHTAGIAVGNGAGTNYRGIAYESDICLVSNYVYDDRAVVEEDLRRLYTTATDVLGFKYIFDYADEVGKPCVVSFSEGTTNGFTIENELFREVISRMVGAGHILVAAAGNESLKNTYFLKTRGQEEAGTFLKASRPTTKVLSLNMLSKDSFTMKLHLFDNGEDNLFTCNTTDLLATKDSIIIDSVSVGSQDYVVIWNAFTPDGDYDGKIVYQIRLMGPENIGSERPIAMAVEGKDAEVECFRYSGQFVTNSLLSELCAGEPTRNVLAPGAFPDVICVGSIWHRGTFQKDDGTYAVVDKGTPDRVSPYSSVGPTPNQLIKPDVVAIGSIVSAGSSYYYAAHGRTYNDIALTNVHDRTYPWTMCCGTSMATPVVAGIIALWLQAKPDLTPQEAMAIIANTSRHPDETLEYPNNMYGYGEIDAAAGIRYLIQTSVKEVHQEPKGSSIAYNLQGMPVDDSYRGIVIRDGRKYHQK